MVSDKSLANTISGRYGGGYWKIGEKYFFDKAECLRYASLKKDFNITFHYNDEFYSTLQWKEEPKESLKELYKQRAIQLREKYDYIILSFSGGSDSYNVLDSFLDNGIFIDCVATSYPIKAIEKLKHTFDARNRSAENVIFEYTEVAHPKLLEVSKVSPKTEIAVLDHTDTAIDMLLGGKLHIMPVGGIGAAPGLAGHYLIGQKVREYAKRGKAVYVTGVDKPKIFYNPITKNFGTYFDDISLVLGNWTKDAFDGYRPYVEHFYYTTDMPAIWQKQLALYKRALAPILDRPWQDINDALKQTIYIYPSGNYVFNVHHIFFKKLLYENWNDAIFQAGKPSGYFFQEHSNWYIKSDLTDKRAKDYHYGQVMEFLHGIDPSLIIHNTSGLPLKFKNFSTKPILIS